MLISRATDLPGFLVAAVVAAFGFGVSTPLIQATVFRCVPQEARGSASNTSYVGLDVGNIAGAYLGGVVIENLEPLLGSEEAAYSVI